MGFNKEYETRVGRLMNSKNLTTRELTNKINEMYPYSPIAFSTISKIANGRLTNYTVDTLVRLCKALECHPIDIIEHWD